MLLKHLAQRPQPILWIAMFALVLMALGNHMRIKACTGQCGAVIASQCCSTEIDVAAPSESCCCCSDTTGDLEGEPEDEARSSCPIGCCFTLSFDIDIAPVCVPADGPHLTAQTLPPTPTGLPKLDVRRAAFQRPFDRGPPRVDRCSAMRACTVLLI